MISFFDRARSQLLKIVLQHTLLNHLFRKRPTRILFFGVLALFLYFFGSIFFPLWILVLGPLILGIPHLISSLRYNFILGNKPTTKRNYLIPLQGILWSTVLIYRISVDLLKIELPLHDQAFLVEFIALFISFVSQFFIFKAINKRSLFYSLLFIILVYATNKFPVQVGLILLIGHNYLPLITWQKSCRNEDDFRTFIKLSSLYIILTTIVLSGTHEVIYSITHPYFIPQKAMPFLNLDFIKMIEPFGGTIEASDFWFRIVVLYAFSQAFHYFIWLKAIPENYQPQNFPPSFRWSFQKLSTDFGGVTLSILFMLFAFGTIYWAFFEYQTARTIYFAIASYHGFMEISCLPFLQSNRKL